MPLIKSASKEAVSENIRREMAANKPQRQAVAIALDIQRRAKKARGGATKMAAGGIPWYARAEAKGIEHSGFIHSPVAGRTDKIPLGVKGNSYVVPADVVSSVGQGNSLAGANGLSKLFSMGPYGTSAPKMNIKSAKPIRQKFADGGDAEGGAPVDIIAAGGEFVIDPDKVAEIGGGDMTKGHNLLDAMVSHIRRKTIKTLRKLPKPKRS